MLFEQDVTNREASVDGGKKRMREYEDRGRGGDRGGRGGDRGGRGGGGGYGGGRGYGPRPQRNPEDYHDALCSDCGAACKVPFKPTEGRAVYCNDCHRKRKAF